MSSAGPIQVNPHHVSASAVVEVTADVEAIGGLDEAANDGRAPRHDALQGSDESEGEIRQLREC